MTHSVCIGGLIVQCWGTFVCTRIYNRNISSELYPNDDVQELKISPNDVFGFYFLLLIRVLIVSIFGTEFVLGG